MEELESPTIAPETQESSPKRRKRTISDTTLKSEARKFVRQHLSLQKEKND